MNTVNVSVRRIVEFILRSGNIDAAYMGANRALEGTRVHQRLQKRKKNEAALNGVSYKPEVFLETTREHRGMLFHVEGRADGVQTDDTTGALTIDEIKSTLGPVPQIEPDADHWHWAQAKCYGYMVLTAYENAPDGLTVALTYCQVETEDTSVFAVYYTFAELDAFFVGLLDKYSDFARMDRDRLEERNESVKALAFPYGAYRLGQRELAVAVFAAVKQKRKLFVQAPTGIGKTISTLFPAVKSLAEGFGEKIFYLTAKTIARQVAEDAFQHMTSNGLRMRAITITARDKICFCETRLCDPVHCMYANGHFDRINEAILDCVREEIIINRSTVEQYARKHTVCPAEFQLDVALFCDAVICDYNHAYDPKAKLQRFFQFGGDYILLNDEAHNLVDRARDMFSAGLYRNDFQSLRKDLGRKHPLYKPMGIIAKEIRACWDNREKQEPFCVDDHPKNLLPLLLEFAQSCDEILKSDEGGQQADALMSLYFGALDYLRVSELYDERYAFFCDPTSGFIRLYCIDPSKLLAREQKKNRACVFFSATLAPLPYFRTILGGEADDYTLRLASPFPRENLCLMIDDRISTRYKDRAESYDGVAVRLCEMVSGKTGNYMAFFSSYAYLTEVYDRFTEHYPNVRTSVQSQDMDDESRETFLAQFTEEPDESMLAFVVLGGIFSEGIDLKGNRLIGVAVVGVGLPLITAERDVIKDYYNRYNSDGFAFAYIYPGMNKVLQAAGRVIRTEADRGIVLLIDRRFSETAYRSLFPLEWAGFTRLRSGADFNEKLRAFWGV